MTLKREREISRMKQQRDNFRSTLLDLKGSVSPEQFSKILQAIDLAIDSMSDRADAVIHEWERLVDIIETVEGEN